MNSDISGVVMKPEGNGDFAQQTKRVGVFCAQIGRHGETIRK